MAHRGAWTVVLAAGALLAAAPVHAGDDGGKDKEDRPKPAPWNVSDPGGPFETLEFDTTEGTWMSVDVSPDGKRLAFDLLGDLYTMPVEGGEATLLSGGLAYEVQPRWSPDGKRVLFTSDRGGGDNLWTMDADGSNPAPVTKETFRLVNNGRWHPSGEWVVGHKHFTSRRSLGAGEAWMCRVPGTGAGEASAEGLSGVQLTKRKNDQQDAGQPVFSPDGRFLYWSEDMSGGETFQYNKDPNGSIYWIRRLELRTGEMRELVRRPGGAVSPTPSPDGKTLAFVRRVRTKSVLALLDLETGAVRDLWDGLSLDQQETWAIFGPYPGLSWTPDGGALVVWAKGHLHRVDAATGKATEIPFRAHVKQRVAKALHPARNEGGPTFEVRVVRWPRVAPDGKTAVFQALGRLWRKDLPDGTPRRLTGQEGEFEFAPWISADGATVVYCSWNDTGGGRVKAVGPGGGILATLEPRPGHYTWAALSPDGRSLVYRRDGGDRYRGGRFGEDPGIWLRPVEGEAPARLLVREGESPRFGPDGQRVLFLGREGEKAALVSVDLLGSDRRVLATSERATDFVLSPDGRWLAFEELWDAWVVPFPGGPLPLAVSPEMKDLPCRRLSEDAGTYLSWSADSGTVRWSLGPDLFEAPLARVFTEPPKPEPGKEAPKRRGVGAAPVRLGWTEKADVPATDVWLVGGKVVPMHDASVIEDGVIHVQGNRIVSVGRSGELPVPPGARVLDCRGCTLLPGLVDVHSHTGASEGGVYPAQSWGLLAKLAFGVTTIHDPSNDTQMIHAEAELVKAGLRLGPRILSTGTILYGAEGDFKAVIDSLDDARRAIRRTAAWGARSVKSYQQPRREQRQEVIAAARELGVQVMPEGGSTFFYNMTHFLDGHTTLEHSVPVAPLYEPELRLMSMPGGTCYTPTLVVGYGGLFGENWWYAKTNVWEDERLLRFVPRSVVDPRARRRPVAPDEEYHHFDLARLAAEVVRRGGNVEIGGHGQMQGLDAHWKTWMLAQGGLSPHEALRCATLGGAKALGLEGALGSLRPGLIADLVVVEGDPLADVRRSREVRWTMVNGRLYDARTLEQLEPERRPLPPGPALDTIPGDGGHTDCLCGR